LEILDPPISETRLSDFAGLGPTEQTVALHIGQKLDCPVFPENQIFLDLIGNLMLTAPNHSLLYFHP
jgi:hypothetical protein